MDPESKGVTKYPLHICPFVCLSVFRNFLLFFFHEIGVLSNLKSIRAQFFEKKKILFWGFGSCSAQKLCAQNEVLQVLWKINLLIFSDFFLKFTVSYKLKKSTSMIFFGKYLVLRFLGHKGLEIGPK